MTIDEHLHPIAWWWNQGLSALKSMNIQECNQSKTKIRVNWLYFKTNQGHPTLPQINIYIWACRGELGCVCACRNGRNGPCCLSWLQSKADLCGLALEEQLHLENFCQGSLCSDSTFFSHEADTPSPPPPQPPCLSFHHSPSGPLVWSSLLLWLGNGEHPFVKRMDHLPSEPNKRSTTELGTCQINLERNSLGPISLVWAKKDAIFLTEQSFSL